MVQIPAHSMHMAALLLTLPGFFSFSLYFSSGYISQAYSFLNAEAVCQVLGIISHYVASRCQSALL